MQFVHRSHAKKARIRDFFLTGQETIHMLCAVPIGQNATIHLVVADFSLHFCVRNEQ